MVYDVVENLSVGEEVHFRAALFRGARDRERCNALATMKLHLEHFTVTPDRQPQPRGQRVDARDAYPVQATRDLVRVLVELAAGVQLGQDDFSGAAPELVILVNVGRDAPAVIRHRDRVVRMDGDHDLVAVPGQRFIDRVVDDLEDHMVQARAIGRIADVHARALAHGLQALEHLDGVGAIRIDIGLLILI